MQRCMQDFTVQALDRIHATLFEVARDVRALDGRLRGLEAALARVALCVEQHEVVPAAGAPAARVIEWEVRDRRDG